MDAQRSNAPTALRAGALLLAIGLAATAAMATVGFDSRIRLLGYEPSSGRIYYVLTAPRGEPMLPRVRSIGPSGRGGPEPVEHVLWGPETNESDLPAIYDTIRAFGSTLDPLEPRAVAGWRLEAAVAAHDTIRDEYFGHEIERFRMRLRFEAGPYRADTLVTAFFNRTVVVYGVYRIPGDGEALAHFSFTGDRFETGYLTDALLVMPRRACR